MSGTLEGLHIHTYILLLEKVSSALLFFWSRSLQYRQHHPHPFVFVSPPLSLNGRKTHMPRFHWKVDTSSMNYRLHMTRVDLRKRTNSICVRWNARVDKREKVKGKSEIEERLRSEETEA